jgi:hypothetical protein
MGVGPSTLPSELFKRLAGTIACLYDGIAVDTTLSLTPPIQWRGSDVAMIVKRPGVSATVLRNLREIFLADNTGKAVTGELRARTTPYIGAAVVNSQSGAGYNGRGPDAAHLTLRAVCGAIVVSGRCAVAPLTDVQTAFATICRRHSLALPEHETMVVQRLRLLSLADDDIADVMAESHRAVEWGHTPPRLFHLAATFHRALWAAADYHPGVVASDAGCQAGVPYADIISIIGLSRVTRRVSARLQAEGLANDFSVVGLGERFGLPQPTQGVTITEQCIVDDVAHPIAVAPAHLERVISWVTGIAFDEYWRHGLRLNFAVTKTAAVINFAGTDASAAQARIAALTDIPVGTVDGVNRLSFPI